MMQLFFHGIFKCFTVNIQKLTSDRLVLQILMPKNNKIYGSYQLSLVSIHASFQSTSVCMCLRTQSMALFVYHVLLQWHYYVQSMCLVSFVFYKQKDQLC